MTREQRVPSAAWKATQVSIGEGKRLGEAYPLGLGSGIPSCDATAPGPIRPYACTRPASHTGLHMAHVDQYEVAATWEQS